VNFCYCRLPDCSAPGCRVISRREIETLPPPVKRWEDMLKPVFEKPAREFDGFCTPCGGFRTHRRGCPVKK